MRKLFSLLYRIRVFLLFAFLELIALIWISNSRSFQRAFVINSSNQISGSLLETTQNFEDYFNLKEQNKALAIENALLRATDSISQYELITNPIEKVDSTTMIRYTYVEGEIINSSYHKARNFMTINRGEIHGLTSNMGVISQNGIVGVTHKVSKHFCTVLPLINPLFRVSGKIKNSSFFGPIEWQGGNYQYAYLIDIPRYANIQVGDTIVTDSRSQLFPAGIPIGTIESHEMQEDQNFFKIKLKLSTDFASVNHIYVVQDKLKLELQELENQEPR